MSLTRKYLKEIGIESEKIDLIIEAHTDTLDSIKAERDELKAKAERVDSLIAENESLKSATASESEWKNKFDSLNSEFEAYKQEQNEKDLKIAKESEYKKLLKEAGVSESRIDTILRVTDLNAIEMNEGAIKDADSVKESIKSEWKDFIVSTDMNGAKVEHPSGNDGQRTFTQADIRAMSRDEINKNWDAIKSSLSNKGE